MSWLRLLAALLAPAAAAIGLAQPVPEGRGADEVAFMHLVPVTVAAGDHFEQLVPAEAAGLSGIELPYLVDSDGSARLAVEVRSGGRAVTSQRLTLARPTPLEAALSAPSQYAEGAGVAVVRFAPQAADVTVTVERTGGDAHLVLFTSLESGQRLPGLEGHPDRSLALRSEYGGVRPAVDYAGTVLDRIQRWAPPWLPTPVVLLLALVLVVGAAALVLFPGDAAG